MADLKNIKQTYEWKCRSLSCSSKRGKAFLVEEIDINGVSIRIFEGKSVMLYESDGIVLETDAILGLSELRIVADYFFQKKIEKIS